MFDGDLAGLYQVKPKTLNQAVKRNRKRFPGDFMFQLTWEESRNLRSHFVTLDGEGSRSQSVDLNRGGNVKCRPCALAEQKGRFPGRFCESGGGDGRGTRERNRSLKARAARAIFNGQRRPEEMDYAEIQEKYGGKHIARREGEVVASAATSGELLRILKQRRLISRDVVVEFVRPKGTIYAL